MLSAPLLGIGGFQALFAPKKDPWPLWEAHDPESQATVDHDTWDRLLQRYVQIDDEGINRVVYVALNQTGRSDMDAYIAYLTAQPVSRFNRVEQLAYWINLYNALTVQTVAQAYPVDSIRDIRLSPGLFSFGPWDKKLITVEGVELSLNDIEHRILRPLWDDPLIRYGLNCAALGCPNLARNAYTGMTADQQLKVGARRFINSPRGAWFHNGKLGVSSIYAWFKEDFGGDDVGILAHLKTYADPGLRARLDGVKEIRRHEYDWGLAAVR
jgi:hypothetical protein